MIKAILALIPVKRLAKYLPDVLAYVLTKGLGYVLTKYPKKSRKVLETAEEISIAMVKSVQYAEDGVISKDEIEKAKALWKVVFK